MPASQLSEFGVYKLAGHLIKIINDNDHIPPYMEDVLATGVVNNNLTVISTSTFIEKINFDLTYMPLKHIGFKAITIALTSIFSKYASPGKLLIEMSFTNQFTVEHCEEISRGMAVACKRNNVSVSSLKISPAIGGLSICVTAIGEVAGGYYIKRDTANINDLICTTGDLGGAYAGLLLLEREKAEFMVNPDMQPDLHGNDYVLQRYIRPETPRKYIDMLQRANIIPTAMISNGAGLSTAVIQICKASNKGCMLFEDKLPIDAKTISTFDSFKIHPVTGALNGGDDYELLFTVKQDDYEKIKDLQNIHVIGYITEDKAMYLVPTNGQMIPLKAQGL